MVEQMFVNLPVKNLKRTMKFWQALGFRFNKEFTDEKAASLVLGKNAYAMLVTEKFFKGFLTKKRIVDTRKAIESITALEVGSRGEVDALVKKAKKAGAKMGKPYDYGYMYGQALEDLDGHAWEFFYMNLNGYRKWRKQQKK